MPEASNYGAWQQPEGSWASSEATRRRMQANKAGHTRPELALRRAVHAAGLRFRTGARPVSSLRRTADLVFPREKVAVFLDGCFFHGCPAHFKAPRTNSGYWHGKILRNVRRDRDTDEILMQAGWVTVRVWEHEDPTEAAIRVDAIVRVRRAPQRPVIESASATDAPSLGTSAS